MTGGGSIWDDDWECVTLSDQDIPRCLVFGQDLVWTLPAIANKVLTCSK